MATSEATRVAESSVESSTPGVEWSAIIAGAIGAVGITIILICLGSGVGLATVSPWSFSNTPPAEFGMVAAIWLIVMQWLSSAIGGYLAGRLRIKWVGIRTDEIFFRDTAHGFLAWALATLLVAAGVALTATVAGSAAAAAGAVGSAATSGAPAVAAKAQSAVGASFSLFTCLSFLIGAFVGSVSGAVGGYHRDEM